LEGAVTVIYFIQQGEFGPIKIGKTNNIEWRMADLKVGSPYPLRLLATLEGEEKEEKLLQAAFSAFKMNGEWFNPDYCLLHFIYHHTELNNGIRDYKPNPEVFTFPELTPKQNKIADGILNALKDGPKPKTHLHSNATTGRSDILEPVLDYLEKQRIIESVITGEANIEHKNPKLKVWRLLPRL